jgi:hypothetical protein
MLIFCITTNLKLKMFKMKADVFYLILKFTSSDACERITLSHPMIEIDTIHNQHINQGS